MAALHSDSSIPARADGRKRRVRLWLGAAASGAAVFMALGMSLQTWEPWLTARLGEDSFVVQFLFELFGTVLIAVPVVGLIGAISALGDNRGVLDDEGRVTLRVRSGARRLHVALCGGLFVLFASGAAVLTDETLALRLSAVAAAAFTPVAAYIIWTARVVYDRSGLEVSRFARHPLRLDWRDLQAVTWVEAHNHHRLDFTKGRKATISSTYAGANVLIGLAMRMLARDAGASRS